MKAIHLSQMDLVVAILKEVERQCAERGLAGVAVASYQTNAACAAATSIVREFARDPRIAPEGAGVRAWLQSDDTGASSRAMARHLCGMGNGDDEFPWDPADFGRCYRFLRAVPEAKAKLSEMAKVSPVWARLIERWQELEALYEEELPTGSGRKLYALMKQLIGDAR